MEKERQNKISRKDFLRLAGQSLAGLGLLPFLEQGQENLPQDLLPEKRIDYSVWPLEGEVSEIMGDGKKAVDGYTHLMPTIGYSGKRNGGHHIGVDFNLGDHDEDLGLSLRLVMNGICVFTGEQTRWGLGKIAIFCHEMPNGELLYSRYAHLDDWNCKVGKSFEAGDIVAKLGNSGRQDFAHLHLDMANREVFEKHYMFDPWWYPFKAPIWYLNKYFSDPAEVIGEHLKPEEVPQPRPRERVRRGYKME